MNKLLVILGPTASGKSDLAIKIAKLFNGEIISADSRQIYRDMDLGTAKVEKDKNSNDNKYLSSGIRHHMLDIADPKEYFSVSQYQQMAMKIIKDIQKRNKLPILCGGTGLYISSIIEGWQFPNIEPDNKLRTDLENLSTEELCQKLEALDPDRAKNIDKDNRRRLIRALEIAIKTGKSPKLKKNPPDIDIFILGLNKSMPELKALISKRIDTWLNSGMIEEIGNLKKSDVTSKRLEDFGLQCRWVNRFLEDKITEPQMRIGLFKDTCRFVKHQMTWFRKMKNIWWIDSENQAIAVVSQWLKTKQSPV